MKKILAFMGLLGVIYALIWQVGMFSPGRETVLGAPRSTGPAPKGPLQTAVSSGSPSVGIPAAGPCDGSALAGAYRRHQHRIEVCGRGIISRVLQDDLRGTRHQRFIVRQPSGQTLLIAHNVDIAPRITGLRPGMPVEFEGEYEWNPQGGVVHWTHRDPAGRHPGGWIRYADRVYQ